MRWKIILGIVLSLVFLFLGFRNVEFENIWISLKGLKYHFILLAMIWPLVFVLVRAYRWRILVKPIKVIGVKSLFASIMISFMANNILPFRIGEIFRSYSLGKKENISKSTILATQVVERFYDMMSIIIVAGVVVYMIDLPDWFKKSGISLSLISFLGLIIVLVIMKYEEKTLKFFEFIFQLLPHKYSNRLINILQTFFSGLRTIKSLKDFFMLIIFSFFIWFVTAIQIIILYYAFSFNNIPLYSSVIVLVFTVFIIAIPQAPGFLGGFHYACKEGLVLFGINPGAAMAFAIVYHALSYITITLFGLFYFTKENLKFSEVKS